MESQILSDGRITIPKSLRDRLNVKPGDRILFFIRPDGLVALAKALPNAASQRARRRTTRN